ncbi:MAG TPA: 2-oxo acid dehydrogenase subunit E2, partial [Bryobacteraceae bacterium]|nr:2-oxo acid dehydrogenase subunit E2 [Bryobacteraceae bacterium]
EGPRSARASKEPTLKALLLLSRFGLKIDEVPFTGERLEAADVVAYARAREGPQAAAVAAPPVAGHAETLTPAERGMLRTVLWHRQEAVSGYVEISYDPEPWARAAAEFQKRHRLLTSPLLALMAYRLVQVARQMPRLNATIVEQERYQYDTVNLGFTVQTRSALHLVTVENADQMGSRAFVDALLALQMGAMKEKLQASPTSGATIAFTSMARWQVTRHAPILPPYTSFMAAHSHAVNGAAALGATYDHRVLTGGEAAAALRLLSQPLEEESL